MFRLETYNPGLLLNELRKEPYRYLPNPAYDNLSGIDLGKFFSRAFHVKGIVKKVPRMLSGAASGALLGGGWSGAAAGAISAAAFERKAGTSLFQDIYRGGLYGMIGGGVVGAGKVALGKSDEAGLVGTGYNYIQKTFFGPKPTIQYDKPIGPMPYEIAEKQYKSPIGPELPNLQVQGPCIIPNECPIPKGQSSIWSDIWSVTKRVIPEALPVVSKFGEKTLDYMTASQQAKAAEYGALSAQQAMQTPMGLPSFDPFSVGPISGSGGNVYGSGLTSVPGDIGSGSGSTAFPIESQMEPTSEMTNVETLSNIPTWVLIGGGGLVLLLLMR